VRPATCRPIGRRSCDGAGAPKFPDFPDSVQVHVGNKVSRFGHPQQVGHFCHQVAITTTARFVAGDRIEFPTTISKEITHANIQFA